MDASGTRIVRASPLINFDDESFEILDDASYIFVLSKPCREVHWRRRSVPRFAFRIPNDTAKGIRNAHGAARRHAARDQSISRHALVAQDIAHKHGKVRWCQPDVRIIKVEILCFMAFEINI